MKRRHEFGVWLRRQREGAGKTQNEVAAAVGITQVHLSRVENGDSGTSPETAMSIAKFLKISAPETLRRAGFSSPAELTDSGEFEQSFFHDLYARHRVLGARQKEEARVLLQMVEREFARLEGEASKRPRKD